MKTKTYSMNEVETKRWKKFGNKHWEKCRGETYVTFIETGIGQTIKVMCNKCKKIKNIADFASW